MLLTVLIPMVLPKAATTALKPSSALPLVSEIFTIFVPAFYSLRILLTPTFDKEPFFAVFPSLSQKQKSPETVDVSGDFAGLGGEI